MTFFPKTIVSEKQEKVLKMLLDIEQSETKRHRSDRW